MDDHETPALAHVACLQQPIHIRGPEAQRLIDRVLPEATGALEGRAANRGAFISTAGNAFTRID